MKVFGIAGYSGAGKTTTAEALTALLLEHGAFESDLGWNAVFHAVAFGTTAELEEAVTSGIDLEARDHDNRTPFLLAAARRACRGRTSI